MATSHIKPSTIEDMIAEEDDPKQRLVLLILNNINNSLVENTKTTAGLSKQFEDHLTRFEAKVEEDAKIMNRGRGMWKVIAWVLGVAQSALLGLAAYASNDLASIHKSIAENQLTDVRIELRLNALEKK